MKPHLTKLTAKGLKSGDFEHDLQRVNLFVGRSASGKTARIEALRLALLGRVPDLGKLKSASLQLSRSGTIEVSISDSVGRYRWRRFSGESKVQSTGDLPDAPEVLLDPNVYFGLSDEKKIEYAFGLVALDEADCLRSVQEFGEPVKRIPGEPIQLWIKRAIETLKADLSNERKVEDALTKTVRVNVQFQGTPPNNPESELRAARERNTQLRVKLNGLAAEQNKLMDIDAQVYRITGELKLGQPNRVQEIEMNIAKLRTDIEKLSMPSDSKQVEKLQARVAKLEAKAFKLSETYKLISMRTLAERSLSAANAKINELSKDSHSVRKAMLDALEKAVCPTCGGKVSADKIKSDFTGTLDRIAIQRKETEVEREKLTTEIESLSEKITKSQATDKKAEYHRKELATAKAELSEAMRNLKSLEADRTSQLKVANDQLAAFNKALSETHAAAAKREQLESVKASLEKQLEERTLAAVQAEIAMVESQIKANDAQISSLVGKEREYASYRADEQRNAQTLLKSKEVRVKIDNIKETIEAFESVRARMIEIAMGGILQTVNRFTKCVPDMRPVEYFNGELGRRFVTDQGSQFAWIPHSTFSGTEKALTYAGISAALAKDAPILLVMLDEMGRFDPDTVTAVLRTMVELTESDEIGQFIGCISWPIKAPEGVKVIEV